MRILFMCAAVALLSLPGPNTHAAENSSLPVKPLVDENFSTAVAPDWRVGKGEWKIVDGAWQGAELVADKHGAVARKNLEFTDAVFDFDFKFDGAKAISLSLNDKKGHVARVLIRPSGCSVLKDDHDHTGPDQRVVLSDIKQDFRSGVWYHARVEVTGPRIMAQIGDSSNSSKSVGGENPLIGNVKSNFGFTVSGQTASFKNLRVTAPAKD